MFSKNIKIKKTRKTAARPWLVASGESSNSFTVATRPPIGDAYILLGFRRWSACFDQCGCG